MKFRFLLMIGFLSLALAAQAQAAYGPDINEKQSIRQEESKLGIGQSLTVSPNPLPKEHAELSIHAVGIDIFSYKVYTAAGQIVELENLSGRPDTDLINLTGAVDVGTYLVVFETTAGKVSRKFLVI